MNPPPLTRPLVAAAALATLPARGETSALPPVPDAMGFAGTLAGVYEGQLLAGGGANFPDA